MQTSALSNRLAKVLLATLVAAALTLGSASAATAAIKFGAYSGADGQQTAMESPQTLDKFISMVGRTPDILNDYSNVTEPLLTPAKIANIEAHHTTPMVTWQLYKSGWSGPAITFPDIIAGRYDSNLRQAAQLAKGLPFEVLIRFAHEMNGDWYPWRPGGESGNVGTNYVDAWRHVVSIFRQEGATNVKWVWSPNIDYGNYPFAQYFPGDEWVDYVALDGYNWGTGGVGVNKWQSLYEVFAPSYAKLTQMSTKPVMIAETSSSESGGDKAAWIRQGFLRTIPEKFPRVAAVVWFDRNQEQDWRVNSSSASLAAYREVASSKIYGGTVDVPLPPLEGEAPTKRKKKAIRSLNVTPTVTTSALDGGSSPQALAASRFDGTIVYRLAESSVVKITIERRSRRGRFAHKMTITRRSHLGRSRVPFSRLGGRLKLRRGVYRVSVDALEDSGRPRHDTFRVLPRRR